MSEFDLDPRDRQEGLFDERLDRHSSMRIFAHNRDRGGVPDAKAKLEAARAAISALPEPSTIEAITSLGQIRELFSRIYDVEKQMVNRILTVEYQKNRKSSSVGLFKSMFFAIKRSIRIKYQNNDQAIFMDSDITREFFTLRISEDLKEAFKVACKPEQRAEFIREILDSAGFEEALPASIAKSFGPGATRLLPTQAPAQWTNRPSRQSITPPRFVMDVYGPWLGRGLSRGDIRRLDEKLYHALYIWQKRHPDHPDVLLLQDQLPERTSPSPKP